MSAYSAILLYLEAVNLAAFALFGIDKRRAKRRARRIPEAVLLGSVVLGGGVGALAGMRLFRHKTRKPRFRYGVPAILILEVLLLLLIVWSMGF